MEPFEKAEWIWLDGFGGVNTYVSFFETVKASAGQRVVLYISADTNYALWANGELVTFGQYSDYPFDKVYDEVDLSGRLSDGENAVRIDCWHQGRDTSTARNGTAGVIYEFWTEDGIICASSENTAACPISAYKMGGEVENISPQLGVTFCCDARKLPEEKRRAVSVSKSLPVRRRPVKKLVLGGDEPAVLTVSGSFSERRGKTAGERMQYAAMSWGRRDGSRKLPDADGYALCAEEGEDGVFAVVDTGRENAGILSLDIELPKDAEVLVGWGEHLEDLRVRSFVGGRNFCAVYYGKSGRNVFQNPFRRLGMRYLQLHIYAESAVIRYAGIRTTDYPVEHENRFVCADALHTRIYEVCKRTLLMSMHEHYEDCPWREQALYTMDSRNQMLCGYYAFGEFEFPKASLRLIAQSLREDNMFELCSPARVSITIPSFSAIFLTQVLEYVKYSGDTAFIGEVMPAISAAADEFVRRTEADTGLIACFPEERYWNFYEWQTGLEGSISGFVRPEDMTYDAPLMAFVSMGLRSAAELLDICGDRGGAEKYRSVHARINEALNRYFWDEKTGAYASYLDFNGNQSHLAELTNALCVCAGAAKGERLERVAAILAENRLIPVTLSSSIFKYEAMMCDPRKYARAVFADIAEKWGTMLCCGATTFWETIKGASDFQNAGSLCHGWSAVPIYFYHKYALALDGSVTGLYECRTEAVR